jgi:hypothetical protein
MAGMKRNAGQDSRCPAEIRTVAPRLRDGHGMVINSYCDFTSTRWTAMYSSIHMFTLSPTDFHIISPTFIISFRGTEHRLRVFGNRVLRRIFGPKREAGEDCTMRSFIT